MIETVLVFIIILAISIITPIINSFVIRNVFDEWIDLAQDSASAFAIERRNVIFYGIITLISSYFIEFTKLSILGKIILWILIIVFVLGIVQFVISFIKQLFMLKEEDFVDLSVKSKLQLVINGMLVFLVPALTSLCCILLFLYLIFVL